MKKTYISIAIAAAITLGACGGGDNNVTVAAPAAAPVANAVALTTANELWLIDIANPSSVIKRVAVTGIAAGEDLLGIDYRPSNGKLYGITKSAVYVIDDATGVASARMALTAQTTPTPSFKSFTAPLAGQSFGVDFNPVVDRLRVVGDSGMSLVVNVDSGAVNRQADIGTTDDGTIASMPSPAGFSITAAAYTNSISKPVSTQLWDIDTQSDRLLKQNAMNNDSLLSGEVTLGVDATDVNGFDIDGFNNKGYAALTVNGLTSLYEINLAATSNAANKETAKPLGNGMVGIKGITLKTKTTAAYALTSDGKLLRFLPTAPQMASTDDAKPITGLNANEKVLGIDFRPADGKLYGITDSSRIITINKATGAATVGRSLSLTLDNTASYTVDFNPAADRLRVMNSKGLNLRINVDLFSTIPDGTLRYASGTPNSTSIIAGAYTNSFTPGLVGSGATTLNDIDVTNQSLALQAPPNDGLLTTVGTVTPAFTRASIDIIGGSNGLPLIGLADTALGVTSLYSINLASGATTAYPPVVNGVQPPFTIGTGMTAPVVNDIALTLE